MKWFKWKIRPTEMAEPDKDGHIPIQDGQPVVVGLTNWGLTESLDGSHFIKCCDCGLVHHMVYEVCEEAGEYFLVLRAYRWNK